MHACGHDTHMTAWLGTARRLAAMKDQWSGTLVMILQPGEETGEGAKAMLADGLYTRFPKPAYVLGIPRRRGASGRADRHHARLRARQRRQRRHHRASGVGGHGAFRQTTKDPIVLASRIVTTLQTLVSRENDPLEPAVVTVGSFQSGAKHNIISDEAKLQLTVRSYTAGSAQAAARRDRAHRPRRGDRRRHARRPHAGRHRPRRAVHAGDLQYGEAVEPRAGAVHRPFRRRADGRLRRRRWSARISAATDSTDKSMESLMFWVGGMPQAEMGRGRRRPAEAAVAAQPVLGARCRNGDLHRDRSDDDRGAGCAEEELSGTASALAASSRPSWSGVSRRCSAAVISLSWSRLVALASA